MYGNNECTTEMKYLSLLRCLVHYVGAFFAEEDANMMNQTTEQAEVFHCCRAYIVVGIYCAELPICRSADLPVGQVNCVLIADLPM